MQVKDVITPDPACCTPGTTLRRVAEMTVEHDCGEIPVVDSAASMRPVASSPTATSPAGRWPGASTRWG